MYHNVNKVASLEGYAYLPFNAGEALPLLTSTGINGLLTRFSAVRELTPWDVETIDQGARSMSVMDGTCVSTQSCRIEVLIDRQHRWVQERIHAGSA